MAEEALATSREEALKAAARIGYPVVLKAVADTLTHKSDVGAVVLNLATPDALGAAYDHMTGALKDHRLVGMLVAQQVRGGLELVLGLHRDPEVGLVVMAGAGGVLLELTKDVAFCAPPVSRDKARDMLKRTRVRLSMSRALSRLTGGAQNATSLVSSSSTPPAPAITTSPTSGSRCMLRR